MEVGTDNFDFDRDSPRFSIKLYVRKPGDETFKEYSGNISISGFAFITNEAFNVNEQLEFQFMLPKVSVPLKAEGSILAVNDEPHGKTVRGKFTRMSDEDQNVLERFFRETFDLNNQNLSS
jgi:hypothetical protein